VGPSRERHTSHYDTKYWLFAERSAIAADKKRYSLMVFREIDNWTSEPVHNLRSGSYGPIVLRASTNWTLGVGPRLIVMEPKYRLLADCIFNCRGTEVLLAYCIRRLLIGLRSGSRPCHSPHSAWMTTFNRHAHAVVTRKPCQLYRGGQWTRRSPYKLRTRWILCLQKPGGRSLRPSHSTQYFLRDVSGLQGDVHFINPCVAAGSRLG